MPITIISSTPIPMATFDCEPFTIKVYEASEENPAGGISSFEKVIAPNTPPMLFSSISGNTAAGQRVALFIQGDATALGIGAGDWVRFEGDYEWSEKTEVWNGAKRLTTHINPLSDEGCTFGFEIEAKAEVKA